MRRIVRPRNSNKDALAIFEAERFIQRIEILGRLPSSRAASELLTHLARVVAIAKRLHLEKADPNANRAENCERCAYIEHEYGSELVG